MTASPAARTPAAGRPWTQPIWIGRAIALAAAVALLVYPLVTDDRYYQNMIILSLVFAIGASGLNIISGFAGYISLGQGAFIGLGGYTIGVLAARNPDVSIWWWVPVAGVVAALIALVLGLVSLRS
jgi:ABC-type branched-subunit amino acid transport system permease subunit